MVFIVQREGSESKRDDLWFDFGQFSISKAFLVVFLFLCAYDSYSHIMTFTICECDIPKTFPPLSLTCSEDFKLFDEEE